MLCITKRQLANLVDLGLPKRGNGRESHYVWPEVLQWYLAYKIALAMPKEQGLSEPDRAEKEAYNEAARRKLSAEADLAELKLSRERGEVVGVQDVEKAVAGISANVRARLLSMPSKLASLLVGQTRPKIKAKIEFEVNEALNELTKTATDGDDDGL